MTEHLLIAQTILELRDQGDRKAAHRMLLDLPPEQLNSVALALTSHGENND